MDAGREIRQPVRCEQHVQPSYGAHRVPGLSCLIGAPAAQPGGRERCLGITVERIDGAARSIHFKQSVRSLRANVLHPPEQRLDRLGVRWRQRVGLGDLNLRAVPAVVDPGAEDSGPVAFFEVDQRPDEHHRLTVILHGFDHRPATRLLHEARSSNCYFSVEGRHAPNGR